MFILDTPVKKSGGMEERSLLDKSSRSIEVVWVLFNSDIKSLCRELLLAAGTMHLIRARVPLLVHLQLLISLVQMLSGTGVGSTSDVTEKVVQTSKQRPLTL